MKRQHRLNRSCSLRHSSQAPSCVKTACRDSCSAIVVIIYFPQWAGTEVERHLVVWRECCATSAAACGVHVCRLVLQSIYGTERLRKRSIDLGGVTEQLTLAGSGPTGCCVTCVPAVRSHVHLPHPCPPPAVFTGCTRFPCEWCVLS